MFCCFFWWGNIIHLVWIHKLFFFFPFFVFSILFVSILFRETHPSSHSCNSLSFSYAPFVFSNLSLWLTSVSPECLFFFLFKKKKLNQSIQIFLNTCYVINGLPRSTCSRVARLKYVVLTSLCPHPNPNTTWSALTSRHCGTVAGGHPAPYRSHNNRSTLKNKKTKKTKIKKEAWFYSKPSHLRGM